MGLGSTLSFRMTLWVRKDKGGEASRSCSHSHSQSGAEFSTPWATEGGAVILLGRHTLTGGSQADIARWAVLGNLQELGIKKSRPWFPYRSGGSSLSFEEHSRDRGRLAALEVPGASRGMLLGCGDDETGYVIRYWGGQYEGEN